ncbi:3-hydroxyacyl-CoA dehydrogenase family protein [Streptomyces albus]|uniref:3-hydroxyacyl-CoA dehydrogenase family protein n=1 Tax=Streptomyces albus TaxID=1888 RepID=UPI0034520BA4
MWPGSWPRRTAPPTPDGIPTARRTATAQRAAPDRKEEPVDNQTTIGVVGAGVIGSQVAQTFAQAGHRVVLVDVSEEALERARTNISQALRFHRLLARQDAAKVPSPGQGAAGTESRTAVLERITFTRDLSPLAEAGMVVENVVEDWETKRGVYEAIDPLCQSECLFAVNTSIIPITRVAAHTSRPDRVLGMHFMNPVPLKPMVEVIRGHHTSDKTLERARELLAGIGKETVVVADAAGFVSNRVLMLTVNEAMFTVHENVATAEDVDRLFKGCFGHPMGPLETADLIGLDTVLLSLDGLYTEYADSKYRACPLLRRMVDAGLLGRKSGQGFYTYAQT